MAWGGDEDRRSEEEQEQELDENVSQLCEQMVMNVPAELSVITRTTKRKRMQFSLRLTSAIPCWSRRPLPATSEPTGTQLSRPPSSVPTRSCSNASSRSQKT